MKTSISICMITYNREKYLMEAIDSVLAQSFLDWELIIIDNGSRDDSVNLLRSYSENDLRIKLYLNNDNRISYSRNLALSKCSGKYIAVLDSDDVWSNKEKLQKQFDFLETNFDYVLIGGQGTSIDENGNEIGKLNRLLTDKDIRKKMLSYNNFIHSSVVFNKEKALSCGGYDETINTGIEDYDLWLKLGNFGKVANLPQNFTKYRVHSGNIRKDLFGQYYIDTIKIIKKYYKKYPNYFYNIFKLYYLAIKSKIFL